MRPTLRLQSIPSRAVAAEATQQRDVSGLVAQREQAARALEQTYEARTSGEIERAGDAVVKALEEGLSGSPEPGPAGVVIARVVAAADSRAKRPAVPLSGLVTRLKVKSEVVREESTNAFGIVDLELPKATEGTYELEVLGPDCTVLACQQGRWGPKQPSPVHRIELGRTDQLQPQLERARPLEDSINKARERADLAREVATKALAAQETRLVEYLAEIDAALACQPLPRTEAPRQPLGEVETQPAPEATARAETSQVETARPTETATAATEGPTRTTEVVEAVPAESPEAEESRPRGRRSGGRRRSK
jgi:hypothetical protein